MNKAIPDNYYTTTIEEIHKLISTIEEKTTIFSNPSPKLDDRLEPSNLQAGTVLGLQLTEVRKRLQDLAHNIA